MHESILRDFFLGKVGAKVVSSDIEGSRVMTSQPGTVPVVSQNHIVDMDSEFEVSRPNLIAVCDAFLAGGLKTGDVEFIGYALACLDRFMWDGDQENTLASIIEHGPVANQLPAKHREHPAVSQVARRNRGYPDRAGAAS